MRKMEFLILTALGVFIAGCGMAQETPKTMTNAQHAKNAPNILHYDQNHDGTVSLEEFNTVAENDFKRLDKNANGVLDNEDLFLRQQEKQRLIDWNNDGVLNEADIRLEEQMRQQAKKRMKK